jgi:hypothetical protein
MLDRAAKIRVIVPAVTGVALIAAGVAVGILSAGILSPVSIALWGAGGFLLSGSICAYEYEMSKLDAEQNSVPRDIEDKLIQEKQQRLARMRAAKDKIDGVPTKTQAVSKTVSPTDEASSPWLQQAKTSGARVPVAIPDRYKRLAQKSQPSAISAGAPQGTSQTSAAMPTIFPPGTGPQVSNIPRPNLYLTPLRGIVKTTADNIDPLTAIYGRSHRPPD